MIPSVLQGLRALVSISHHITVFVEALVQFSPGLLGMNLHMSKDKGSNTGLKASSTFLNLESKSPCVTAASLRCSALPCI